MIDSLDISNIEIFFYSESSKISLIIKKIKICADLSGHVLLICKKILK